jgi:hypothetical protein
MRPSFLLAGLGLAAVAGGPAGCFYAEPINQRPSADIRALSSGAVSRGSVVQLGSVVNDPDGQAVALAWRASVCADAVDLTTCDAPFFYSKDAFITFTVPLRRADGTPTQAVRVVLEGTDELGATTKPDQELVLPVLDAPPTLDLRKVSRYGFVIGAPVELFARWTDVDDGPGGTTVAWHVFSPAGSGDPPLVPLVVGADPDPAYLQAGQRLVPDRVGDWDVEVTATDALGAATVKHLPITVVADRVPCLGTVSPVVPPATAALPLVATTRFQVLVVDDDLDGYPTIAGDPYRGKTTFTWSLAGPGGGAHQVLPGVTGSAIELDPAAYAPGDVLELRVEIEDRNHVAVSCADGDPTCSVAGGAACLQRQTWRVVVP